MTRALHFLLLSFRFSYVSSLLVAHESLLRLRRRRHHWHSRRGQHSEETLEGESPATSILDDGDNEKDYRVVAPPTMVPLSRPPLLLLQSSAPVLSKDACSLLSRYFEHLETIDSTGAHQLDEGQTRTAEGLLRDVHDVIDKVTNCPRHDGEVLVPRYVRYESTATDNDLLFDPERFGRALLPDGLHVDTNNGRLFRHVTAILYLTNNFEGFSVDDESHDESMGGPIMEEDAFVAGGGTTFPLAIPLNNEDGTSDRNNLLGAARRLLERNIHHTKRVDGESAASDGRMLERAALKDFHGNNMSALSGLDGRYDFPSFDFRNHARSDGMRVMPKAGKLIYFHNVNETGFPEPTSFHGGEELIALLPGHRSGIGASRKRFSSSTKSILVFFKEVPVEAFRDRGREGFAEEANKARAWTEMMYY